MFDNIIIQHSESLLDQHGLQTYAPDLLGSCLSYKILSLL